MSFNRHSRRSFAKALAGIGGAGYFSGLFRDLWAADSGTAPTRFIVLASSNGYPFHYGNDTRPTLQPVNWRPRAADKVSPAGETGWTLDFPNSVLAPLEKHKDSLVIIEGLDLVTDVGGPAPSGHNTLSTLTGFRPKNNCGCSDDYIARNASLDYYLATRILKNTPPFFFSSDGYPQYLGVYGDDGVVIPADTSLTTCFNRIFAPLTIGGPVDPKAVAKKNEQKAIVDYLGGQARKLQGRLAGTERVKLDVHLDALNTIAQQISGSTSISCTKPSRPGNAPSGDLYMPMVMDFVGALIACNLAQVVSFNLDPTNGALMPWLASKDPTFGLSNAYIHGGIVHNELKVSRELRMKLVEIVHNWYAQSISYFFDVLKAIPEGGRGNAYANSIILVAGNLGDADAHSHTNVPFMLAGGGATWAKGRYLNFGTDDLYLTSSGIPHNGLLVSIANQFGANIDYYGDPAFKGPLQRL